MGNKQFLMMGQQGGSVTPIEKKEKTDQIFNFRNINILDPALLEDYVTSPAGERTIMNMIRRNS